MKSAVHRAAFLSLLPLVMLAGCARDLGPLGTTPLSLEAEGGPGEAAAPDEADLEIPEGPVTLDQVLAFAERHSPLLRVAAGEARMGEAKVVGASVRNPHNPELTTSLGGRWTDGEMFFEAEVGLEQRFEVAGERGLRIKAAELERELHASRLARARWDLRQRVTCAFHRAILAAERVEMTERLQRFAEDLYRISSRRVEAGDEPPIVTVLEQTEMARARQAHLEAHQQLEAIRFELAGLTGWPPERLPELRGETCVARRAPSLERLVELAHENNPVFRMADLALCAAEARARAADRDAWPEPSLGASYTREGGRSGEAPHLWMVTLGVPLPVWERNQGERAEARAELARVRAERDALLHQSRVDLARGASAVDRTAERVEIFGADILPAFEENLARIQRAYEMGELDIHQVTQTRQRLIQGQFDALEALEAYYNAASELQGLVGVSLWPENEEEQ